MENISEKMKSQRNLLERIAEKVPGYDGYHDRDLRRDAEKTLRNYLFNKLAKARSSLTDILNKSANQKSLQSLDLLDQLNRQAEKVADKFRFANYGYVGLFAHLKISTGDLDRLYSYDHSLLSKVEEIEKIAGGLQIGEGLKEKAKELQELIENLDNAIDERDRVVRGIQGEK